LLDEQLHVKICGFGISRLAPTGKDVSMTNDLGSDLWSAPEVLQNKPYGKPADVFSFGKTISLFQLFIYYFAGVILSQLLTKEEPKPRTAFYTPPWAFVPRGSTTKQLLPTTDVAKFLWHSVMLLCVCCITLSCSPLIL